MTPIRFSGRCVDPGTFGFPLDFVDYCDVLSSAGFDLVEVPISALVELGAARVRSILVERGLGSGVFSCPWDPPANGAVPGTVFEQRLRRLPSICAEIASAGGTQISAFFNPARPDMERLNVEGVTARCASIVQVAKEHGLHLTVELNDPTILASAATVTRGSGARLLFDTFHFFCAQLSLNWFGMLPEQTIGWVHLSDVPKGSLPSADGQPRVPPGAGVQNLRALLTALADYGYAGPLSLEILPATDRPSGEYAAELLRRTSTVLATLGVVWSGAAR